MSHEEKILERFLLLALGILIAAGVAGASRNGQEVWKTYRSEKFGYELSYPPEMNYKPYFDGSSGDLVKADTGETLAYFEVWPPSECLVSKKDRTGAVAKEVGIQRAKDVTQADGHGSSSHCGDPVTIRGIASIQGVPIYELELTCINEEYPGAGDDDADENQDPNSMAATQGITAAGKKGPTYFADISQPWLKMVLMADPAGVDPRQHEKNDRTASDMVRRIMTTLKTFPIPKPSENCIRDFSEATR
jgi:hypothetical protein